MRNFILVLATLMFCNPVFAGLFGEMNAFYSTDNFSTSTTMQNSKTFYALDIYANLESKKFLFAGFHVDQWNLKESDGTASTSLTSLNMGPMFMWLIDKRKIYSLAMGYNVVTKGDYNNGSSTEAVTGSSLFATFAAMPEVTENLFVGIKMNYYSLSYNKSTVSSTTSDVSYKRTLIFPSISMAWRY